MREADGDWPLIKKPMIIFKTKIFCFTGRLDNFTRDQARDLIMERGGIVTNAFTSHLDYIVVGYKPGTKLNQVYLNNEKISQLGIKHINILTEIEFAAAILTSTKDFVPRKNIVVPSIQTNHIKKIENTERIFCFDE